MRALVCTTGIAAWLLTVAAMATPWAARAAAPACQPARFVIVIDPGHSREQPGAISARGVPERRFNEALAARVEAALRRAGFEQTLVTNRGADEIALDARAAVANARGAGAFISLHHDSAQPSRLQTWWFGGRRRHYTDTLSGYSLFVSQRNGDAAGSLRLARLIGHELRSLCLRPTAHHAEPIAGEGRDWLDKPLGVYRFDDLVVLRATQMPAVLVEAGLIVNRRDERRLADRDHQDRLASAIARAALAFCAGEEVDRGPGGPPVCRKETP